MPAQLVIPIRMVRVTVFERMNNEDVGIIGWDVDEYDDCEILYSVNHRLDAWLRFRYPLYEAKVMHLCEKNGVIIVNIHPSRLSGNVAYTLVCRYMK
jgi:hypothetical protein